jgi:hypothetical protein
MHASTNAGVQAASSAEQRRWFVVCVPQSFDQICALLQHPRAEVMSSSERGRILDAAATAGRAALNRVSSMGAASSSSDDEEQGDRRRRYGQRGGGGGGQQRSSAEMGGAE